MGIKMADGTIWAVAALSTTSFMLGHFNAGLVDPKGPAVVLPVAFLFGGLIQIIATIFESLSGNPIGATYGPLLIILGAINVWFARAIAVGAMEAAMAVFLAMWAVFGFYVSLVSFRTDRVVTIILALITLVSILLRLGSGIPSVLFTRIGGRVTLVFATLGWYRTFPHLFNSRMGWWYTNARA